MRLFRFGLWDIALESWPGSLAFWNQSADDLIARFRVPSPVVPADSILPADSPPPLADDAALILPVSAAPLAADAPVVWLLPRDDGQPAAFPLGQSDASAASASAAFVTPAGGHVEFVSSQPELGLGGGLFIDTDTRTIIPGAEHGLDEIGSGPDDQLVLAGGTGAMSLVGFGAMFERIVVAGGADYDLTATDANVAANGTLTVSALALDAAHHLAFDGSAERGGHFILLGGAGDDSLRGGGGSDTIVGGGGADLLAGGGGGDRFVYMAAAESSGAHYDTILDFNFSEDVIDLPVVVKGLDAAVTAGALSHASFDADLAAALGGAVLEAGHALFFTPNSGDLAGQTFLVVDGNGEAGYQPGMDFVIHFAAPPPVDIHGSGFLV